MLISRTYKTYYRDYRRIWGVNVPKTPDVEVMSSSSSFSTSSSSIDSSSSTSTNASTISAEGTFLYGGYINQSTTGDFNAVIPINLFLGSTIAGVSDQIVLGISRVSGTAETFFATMNWIEG